jgi:hypothetical protein
MNSDTTSSLRRRRRWGLLAAGSARATLPAPSAGARPTSATRPRSFLRRTQTPGVSARMVPPCPSWSTSYASVPPSTKRTQHPLRWAKVNCHSWANRLPKSYPPGTGHLRLLPGIRASFIAADIACSSPGYLAEGRFSLAGVRHSRGSLYRQRTVRISPLTIWNRSPPTSKSALSFLSLASPAGADGLSVSSELSTRCSCAIWMDTPVEVAPKRACTMPHTPPWQCSQLRKHVYHGSRKRFIVSLEVGPGGSKKSSDQLATVSPGDILRASHRFAVWH